jgi:hypothetical protein
LATGLDHRQDLGMEPLSFAETVARRAETRPDDEVVRLAGGPGWSAARLWQRSAAIAGQGQARRTPRTQ